MARTCPNCGAQAIDGQSQFCNKCGTPFPPDEQPKKVLVRTAPRLVDPTPPPPPVQQQYVAPPPAPEYYAPAAPQAHHAPPSRKARAPSAPAKKPAPAKGGIRGFLKFETFITKKFIRFIYLAGVIAIILLSLFVISTGFTKTTATTDPAEGDAATTASGSGPDMITAVLIGLGLFVFGNLLWRIMCEMLAVVFVINDSLAEVREAILQDQESLFEDEVIAGSGVYDSAGSGEMVSCPVCGKIVPADDIETCDHCGVLGCSSCVRQMGLLKKTFTCRNCFEKK